VSCFCAKIRLSGKNPRKYRKVPILLEDIWSQNTRWRGGTHHLVARARLGRSRGWGGRPRRHHEPSFRLHIPSDMKILGVRCFPR
jgi:hypothetical protein